jgi:outer membrane protein assembly factor BamB
LKRRFITAGLLISFALIALGVPRFGSAQSAPTWNTFHGDANRDGVSSLKGPTTSAETDAWQLPAAVNSSPVVSAGGVGYVGSDDGNVYALDPAYAHQSAHFGAPRWTFKTGGAVVDAPTLSPDGNTLYVGSNDGLLYALNTADGTKRWTVDFGGQIQSSPVVSSDGNTVYEAATTGTLKAIKASDGSTISSVLLNGAVRGNLALSPDGSTLYAASPIGILYAFPVSGSGTGTPTGFYLDGPPLGSPAVDANGNVYITTTAGTLDSFAASNTTQRSGYPYIIPNRTPASTTPAVQNGSVYFGAGNGVFYSLNASSAQIQWQYKTNGPIESSAAVAVGNSTVYFGSDDAQVHALSTGGQQVWARSVGTSVTSSPAIAPDGSLWVGSQSGGVYRFQDLSGPPAPQQVTVTPGPSPTPQPTSAGPSTATPVPTATTPAAVPLTMTRKASVKVGKKQTITFTSSPGIVIHIRVDYPNGDHQSHSVTTNSSGKATYSYKQGASKIKHNKFTATITATAGSGAAQTTQKATYTIGYGRLDVSLEPRSVAPKKVVNIYIHSTVGKKVAAFLLFPNGRFVTIPGTAGPKGWAHIKYKVPTGMTRGSNHKVKVIARPLSNPKLSTQSSFTIK